MAITGVFTADFTDFLNAVAKSDVALVDLSKGAGRVEGALNRMVDQFSGRKVVQDALLMAVAVEEVGGASKLTASNLELVSAKAKQAVEQLKAMGVGDIPVGIQKLADATKPLPNQLSLASTAAESLARQLVGLFSVGAIVAFSREVLRAGDVIQKMADQTGLSTTEVQKLNFIAGQSGTSVESLVSAVQTLEQRLGDESSGATGAIKKLGINLEQFKTQSPFDQLVAVSNAIAALPGPTEQASAAAAIFGKNWKEILPAIKSGMEDVGNQAPVMSDAAVKALDQIGDGFNRAKANVIANVGTIIANLERLRVAFGGQTKEQEDAEVAMLKSAVAARGFGAALDIALPPVLKINEGLAAFAISAEEADEIEKQLTADLILHRIEEEAAVAAIVAEQDAQEALNKLHEASLGIRGQMLKQTNDLVIAKLQEQQANEAFTKSLFDEAVAQDKANAAMAEGNKQANALPNAMSGATAAVYTFQGALVSTNAELERFHAAFANEIGNLSRFSVGVPGAPATRFVPGFASGVQNFGGGLAIVGERGPELVSLPRGSSVLPSVGGGGTTVINNYINGTAQDVARAVMDEITRSMRLGRKFGSA